MSRTILIECSPRRPDTGAVVPLRLVSNAVARADFLGQQWHPAVETVPALESSLGFDGRTFGAAPSPQLGDLTFALTEATRAAASLVWVNAGVTIKIAPWTAAGGDPADGDFATVWTGLAENIAAGDGEARVRLIDNGQALRVQALASKFGSTGDALLDGADALKDRSAETRVPRAWGKLLSIPGVLVDRANGIWLFAGNAATSVQGFYDGGAALTLGVARASLAALQANVPAPGATDYCLDAGGKFLARNWTTPVYPFTAAATFGSAKAADIASAIVTGRTAVTFGAGTVAAFNALQGADCGLYLEDDTTVASALDRLFSGLGAWWRLTSGGTISLGRWGWSAPAVTVAEHRRHRPERLRVLAPTRRRSLGYAHNDRVHGAGDIAAILLAGDLAYADGTAIEALKPATAGATRDRTGNLLDAAAAANEPAGWNTSGGASTAVNSTGGGWGAFVNARYLSIDLSVAFQAFNQLQIPVGGTGRQYAAIRYANGSAGSVPLGGDFYFYKADGAIAGITSFSLPRTAAGVYDLAVVSGVVPADAVSWRIFFGSGAGIETAGWRIDNITALNNEPGADITSGAQVVVIVDPLQAYDASYTGAIVGSLEPTQVRISRGGASIKGLDGVSYAIANSSGLTATIDNTNGSTTKGLITPTAFVGNYATCIVTVTVDGVVQPAQTIIFQKTVALPPALGGTTAKTATDTTMSQISGTSFAAISDVMTVSLASGESLYGTAALDYGVSGSSAATRTVDGKWQYSPTGAGTWSDFATAITGSAANSGGFDVYDNYVDAMLGAIAANQTAAPGAGVYDVRLVAAASASGRTITFYGPAIIEAKV